MNPLPPLNSMPARVRPGEGGTNGNGNCANPLNNHCAAARLEEVASRLGPASSVFRHSVSGRRRAMVMQNRVAILGAVMLALAAAPAFGQNVKTQNNGEAEVRFGDGCVVYYAKNGHRTDSRSGCTSRQNHRADEVVAEYRRQHGFGGNGGYDDVSRVVVNH